MKVMQIDFEDCDVKQHRPKLTIEFTSNVGSLVSWAPRELSPNWKVPRVPLNIQGSALLFVSSCFSQEIFEAKRRLGFSGIPPLPQKRTSLRGEPVTASPHRHIELPSFYFTHSSSTCTHLICSAVIVCSSSVTGSVLSKASRDERTKFLLFMKFTISFSAQGFPGSGS